MKKALVILAAGIGSRYGTGIKQLEPIDNQGNLIIDYSINDAVKSGFNKVVFIIRHDIEEAFRERIGNRIEEKVKSLGVDIEYTYQETTYIPKEYIEKFKDRTKPFGTGHAVLCAAEKINEPFAVINADDFYGLDAFQKASSILDNSHYYMIGYYLKNTLSDNGGVTRGICTVDNKNKILTINETRNIIKTSSGAESEGKVLDINSVVSMNFWCYPKEFINVLREGFVQFLANAQDTLKDEYLLPIIASDMINKGTEYEVIETNSEWFGMTYKEDKHSVAEKLDKLKKLGVYKENLYSDI